VVEDILTPKIELLQIDVDQPHVEDPRVDTPTQAESFRDGRKHTREVDMLLHDA